MGDYANPSRKRPGASAGLTYISYDRLTLEELEDGACPVPPELAIEIISPDQTFGQWLKKLKYSSRIFGLAINFNKCLSQGQLKFF
jgi:hypothetical protein